jgi:hypothetical protein
MIVHAQAQARECAAKAEAEKPGDMWNSTFDEDELAIACLTCDARKHFIELR